MIQKLKIGLEEDISFPRFNIKHMLVVLFSVRKIQLLRDQRPIQCHRVVIKIGWSGQVVEVPQEKVWVREALLHVLKASEGDCRDVELKV